MILHREKLSRLSVKNTIFLFLLAVCSIARVLVTLRLFASRKNDIKTVHNLDMVAVKKIEVKENRYIVVEKKADGKWTGLYNETKTTIEKDQPHTEFLAFLRISKTASTSVMNLLRNNLHSENAFIKKSEYMNHSDVLLHCAYASSTNTSNNSIHWKNPKEEKNPQCGHPRYTRLMNRLKVAVPFLNEAMAKGPHSFYFHPFTIVRDPFDRLVSLFYYMQSIYPAWSDNKNILDDNFAGWMRNLNNKEYKRGDQDIQFEALDDDLDTAINYITGDTPEVFVLTSDCVSTSIRLLAEKKPQFFSVEKVETFLNSSLSNANRRENRVDSKPKAYFNKTRMKERHKILFPEEWHFYGVALIQFRKELLSSTLPLSEVEGCLKKLDQIIEKEISHLVI